jgi:signal transduction histidine kinase
MSEETQTKEQPHILIVDDESQICQMISICLRKINYRTTCAGDATEASGLLEVEQFDAIISDIMMPGEDGVTFLGRVHNSWPDIPVVLMTGDAQLQMAINAIKNGAFDFICKPFDFDHLNKIIQRAVTYHNLLKMEKNYRSELEATVVRRTIELKESMAELDFARSALHRAATEKSAFMSTISHEMRTPMNGVIGSLDLLAEEGLNGVSAEYLAMARQSADNMMALINQLLSFNYGNVRGEGSQHQDLIDFRSLISSLVAELQSDFSRKGLELTLRLADGLPGQIWADREKLYRLFGILLGNALKFTERGYVEVAVSRDCSDRDGEMLHCTITDSGIGIPDGMLESVFEPFVQGDCSLKRRYEGVGLGLAIARQNALLLDSRVWAEHVPTGGSRFVVNLKVVTP